MVLRVGNNAVVLLTTGIPLELVQGDHLRELLRFEIDAPEIARGGRSGYVEPAADLPGGLELFKGVDDLCHQPAGDAVIAGQEGVLLKETLAAGAAVAALAKVQVTVSCQRNILYRLHPIIVYTLCDSPTGRTGMLPPGHLKIDMDFSGNIFYIGYYYIFQIQKL